MDKTFFGGYEKGKRGRSVGKKALVIVAVKVRGNGAGRARLQQIPDSSKEHSLAFVREVIAPGSTVIADCLPVYMNVGKMGYIHQARVPKLGPEEASKLLPRVHQAASLLKRGLIGIHHDSVSKQQLDYYLDEFGFRFNRRSLPDRGLLFYRLVQ